MDKKKLRTEKKIKRRKEKRFFTTAYHSRTFLFVSSVFFSSSGVHAPPAFGVWFTWKWEYFFFFFGLLRRLYCFFCFFRWYACVVQGDMIDWKFFICNSKYSLVWWPLVCLFAFFPPAFFRLEFAFRTEQIRKYLLLHNCFSLFSVWSLQRSMRPLTFHR